MRSIQIIVGAISLLFHRRTLYVIAMLILIGTVHNANAARVNLDMSRSTCQEDQPCWDCAAMGNHVCGPEELTRIVVRLTRENRALVACFDNKSYRRGMMSQCVDDYFRMKGWR